MSDRILEDDVRWKESDGLIVDQDGNIVVILPTEPDETNVRTIKVAPRAIRAIHKFIGDVNSGKLKPRSAAKEFEKILDEYNY